MSITEHTVVILTSNVEKQPWAETMKLFHDYHTKEIRKVIPEPVSERRTAPQSSAIPSPPTSDDLARIENEARTLTRKLLDLGLRHQVAAEAVVNQFRVRPHEGPPHVKGLRDQASMDRRLAPRGGGPQKAASAGACLAIVDWFDEQTK